MRPQRHNGTEGRSGRLNGALPHPLTLPGSRGLLTRLVGETREPWSAGRALGGSARRKSPESPARTQGRGRSRYGTQEEAHATRSWSGEGGKRDPTPPGG